MKKLFNPRSGFVFFGRGVGNKDRLIVGEKLLASESLWLLGSNLLFWAVRVAREVIYCFEQSGLLGK